MILIIPPHGFHCHDGAMYFQISIDLQWIQRLQQTNQYQQTNEAKHCLLFYLKLYWEQFMGHLFSSKTGSCWSFDGISCSWLGKLSVGFRVFPVMLIWSYQLTNSKLGFSIASAPLPGAQGIVPGMDSDICFLTNGKGGVCLSRSFSLKLLKNTHRLPLQLPVFDCNNELFAGFVIMIFSKTAASQLIVAEACVTWISAFRQFLLIWRFGKVQHSLTSILCQDLSPSGGSDRESGALPGTSTIFEAHLESLNQSNLSFHVLVLAGKFCCYFLLICRSQWGKLALRRAWFLNLFVQWNGREDTSVCPVWPLYILALFPE